MAREYGPIYKLTVSAGTRVMVSGVDLVDQMCDDSARDKKVGAGLKIIQKVWLAVACSPVTPAIRSGIGRTTS
jgi:hypothetical protein